MVRDLVPFRSGLQMSPGARIERRLPSTAWERISHLGDLTYSCEL